MEIIYQHLLSKMFYRIKFNRKYVMFCHLILITIMISTTHGNPNPMPQLDLPPLPPTVNTKPEVTPNSYSNSDSDHDDRDSGYAYGYRSDSDRDRNERFGPPYDDSGRLFGGGGNRNYSYGGDQFGRVPNNRDDDKYYADRNPDIINGNVDFNRNSGYNRNRYNDGNGGYQKVSVILKLSFFNKTIRRKIGRLVLAIFVRLLKGERYYNI